MSEGLKPCRDCGSEGSLSHSFGIARNGYEVECAKSMEFGLSHFNTGLCATEAAAVSVWNAQPKCDLCPNCLKCGEAMHHCDCAEPTPAYPPNALLPTEDAISLGVRMMREPYALGAVDWERQKIIAIYSAMRALAKPKQEPSQ